MAAPLLPRHCHVVPRAVGGGGADREASCRPSVVREDVQVRARGAPPTGRDEVAPVLLPDGRLEVRALEPVGDRQFVACGRHVLHAHGAGRAVEDERRVGGHGICRRLHGEGLARAVADAAEREGPVGARGGAPLKRRRLVRPRRAALERAVRGRRAHVERDVARALVERVVHDEAGLLARERRAHRRLDLRLRARPLPDPHLVDLPLREIGGGEVRADVKRSVEGGDRRV